MTTIVNNPTPSDDGGGSGILIGTIVFVAFLVIFIYYGLPAIKSMGAPNINVPAPVINMPSKIDVSVQQPK